MRIIYLYLSFFLLTASTLHSQVVNVESSRMQSDSLGWKGSAGASFNYIKNTFKVTQINVRSHLQYKAKKDIWLILGQYGFLKGGIEKFVRNSFAHLRYNRKINPWLRWEAFAQAQNNYITRIDSRFLIGTGPRFKLADTKRFHLYVASLLMYEYEKERTEPAIFHNDMRNSSYVSFSFRPDKVVEVISTTFYQPILKKARDYRILNESQIRFHTSKRFSFIIESAYLFDRLPAAGAPQTTYQLEMGIQFNFKD